MATQKLTGIWKPIPGSKKYEVDSLGNVRRITKDGYKAIKPFVNQGYYSVSVDINCKLQKAKVHTLMAKAFGIIAGQGEVIYFKNRITTDCFLSNLEVINKRKLGEKVGGFGKKKAVAKIDKHGEVVEIYSSSRECAKKNFFSESTISKRTLNTKKRPLQMAINTFGRMN
jgi:hypothetical protein